MLNDAENFEAGQPEAFGDSLNLSWAPEPTVAAATSGESDDKSASVSSLLLDDKDDPRQPANRIAARKCQRRRWQTRMATLIFVIAFALAPVVQRIPAPADGGTAGPPSAPLVHACTASWISVWVVLLTFALAVTALSLFGYIRETDLHWRLKRGRASQLKAVDSAEGFMDVIHTVVETNYVGLVCSLFGVLAVISGLVALLRVGYPPQYIDIVLLAQMGFGLLVARLGFEIGRRYVQGSILAQHVMALATMSGPARISYDDARAKIRSALLDLIEKHPEWFYFRHAQKKKGTDGD